MKRFKFLIFFGIIVAVAVFLIFRSNKSDFSELSGNLSFRNIFQMGNDNSVNPDSASEKVILANKNDSGTFTFDYPDNFKVTEQSVDDAQAGGMRQILVESQESTKGFEITIIPFDESGLLSAERIHQDLPDMTLDNVKKITISGNIAALTFDSTDEDIGDTHEVWFSANNQLFQFRTYREFGGTMDKIVRTFRFK